MATKNYVSLSKLSTFLDNLKNMFALSDHKHVMSDISDYAVDASLSSTSTNPVENRVIDAEFDAISDSFKVLEADIDSCHDEIATKADADAALYKTEQTLTDTEIEQVHTNLNTDERINNSLAWQLIGVVGGTEILTFSADYNELCVEIKYYGTCGLFNIPVASLSEEEKYYLNGFYGASTSYGYFYICTTSTSVRIFEVYFNGIEVTENCTITVYKR